MYRVYTLKYRLGISQDIDEPRDSLIYGDHFHIIGEEVRAVTRDAKLFRSDPLSELSDAHISVSITVMVLSCKVDALDVTGVPTIIGVCGTSV